MRRAEMARRRKNLSEKRNEEEKVRWAGEAAFLGLEISLSTGCITSLTCKHRWIRLIGCCANRLQNVVVVFQLLKRKPTPPKQRQKRQRNHSQRWSDGSVVARAVVSVCLKNGSGLLRDASLGNS